MLCLSGFELYSRWVPLKMQPHYSQTSRENATPSSGKIHISLS